MLNGLRSHLSYANVIATGALFVALGGGAYALSGVPDRGGVYHGCVATSGALRVVAKASSCRKAKTVRRGKRRVRIPASPPSPGTSRDAQAKRNERTQRRERRERRDQRGGQDRYELQSARDSPGERQPGASEMRERSGAAG